MAKIKFIERVSAPANDNKWYIRKEGGGYCSNYIIKGNPSTNKEKNRQTPNSVLPNCVGYTFARESELSNNYNIDLPCGDAKTWYANSKWEKSQTPRVGSVACWSGTQYGHVAVVESVDSTGFTISESGWSSFYWKRRHLAKGSDYGSGLVFQGFLVNPYVECEKVTTSFLPDRGYWKKGDKDERVGKLCQFFYDTFPAYGDSLGRNKKNLLGNLYGDNCEAWVKEFQKRTLEEAKAYGLNEASYVDGMVGKTTYAILKKYGFAY